MTTEATQLFSDPVTLDATLQRYQMYLNATFVDDAHYANYITGTLNAAADDNSQILAITNSDKFIQGIKSFYNSFSPSSSNQANDCPDTPKDLGPDMPWYVESTLGIGAGRAAELAGKKPYLINSPIEINPITRSFYPTLTPTQANYLTFSKLANILGKTAFLVGNGFSAWELGQNIGTGDYAALARNASIVAGSIAVGTLAGLVFSSAVAAAAFGAAGAFGIKWIAENYINDWFDVFDKGELSKLKPCGQDPASFIPNTLLPAMDSAHGAAVPGRPGSPLIIDLDGDGVEMTSLTQGAVYWDIDNDGFREASAWVKADDGLLVLDRNHDGVINNHSELFGTAKIDGFTVLSELDTIHDNRINASDNQFGELKIWRDLNQDGVSQSNELQTLAQPGIQSINLNACYWCL